MATNPEPDPDLLPRSLRTYRPGTEDPEASEYPLRFEFRLDDETRQQLWTLARRWMASKSAVLRKLIHEASAGGR